MALGDFPNSFAAFAHALRFHQDLNDAAFYYAMGVVYAHYRYTDHAKGCLQRCLDSELFDQFGSDILLRLAFIERSVKNYGTALEALHRAKLAPPNGLTVDDIMFQIAYTCQLKGDGAQAMAIYQDLRNRYPHCEKVVEQYCWFLYLENNSGYLEAVRNTVSDAIAQNPMDPTLILIAARVAMKLKDMETAYRYYRFCITYCSDSPFFWCGLGVLYYRNDQAQDAVVAFQRALYLKPEMPEAWLNIGLIFEQRGEFASAKRIYDTGAKKCPGSAQNEFKERENALNMQQKGHRKYSLEYDLIDIDDAKFITPPPEQFANDYISAVPHLPRICYAEGDAGDRYAPLTTFPPSIFK